MNFANTLKNLRESHDVTQEQLAEYLKVTRPTVAGYETKNRQPDYERLIKIADFFNVTVDYLLTGFNLPENAPVNESSLDHEVILSYKKLPLCAKQDVLKYIRLLELQKDANKT